MSISPVNNFAAAAVATDGSTFRPLTEDQRSVIQAVRAVNAAELFGSENELTFLVDRNTHKAVVRIINKSTGEVVKQIPNESVLRLAEEANSGSE